ncbi:MAG: hypothetical protein IMZ55_19980 [Acidobacteria bacterium]|nr:hypothetical protein [Planctomycetota bacterium]MBE3135756.1 hypothetical protein [Acidobacteriota bacterium]
MKKAVLLLVAALTAVMAVACQPQEVRQSPEKPPAGGAGGQASEPLLLLDGGEKSPAAPAGPVADNTRCFVCHLNYMQEDVAVVHARANIGCVNCHGDCDAHIADESWASGGNGTAPGIMYPREKVNPLCMGCHPKDKMPAARHAAFFAGTAKETSCTDCHGKHRLTDRKCKWK